MTELENSKESFNDRFNQAEGKESQLIEDRLLEIIQSEEQKRKN